MLDEKSVTGGDTFFEESVQSEELYAGNEKCQHC